MLETYQLAEHFYRSLPRQLTALEGREIPDLVGKRALKARSSSG